MTGQILKQDVRDIFMVALEEIEPNKAKTSNATNTVQ